MTKLTPPQRLRLQTHYGLSKIPFHKGLWAAHMFDSQGQRELLQSLLLWIDLKGLALITGPSGVGKSITLRRFVAELDESRYRVVDFTYLPSTANGFLRSLNRKLGLQARHHSSDLFDSVQAHLAGFEQEHGAHPVIVVDDAEGLTVPVLDLLRRLTCYDLDQEDRFSLLLSGTEDLLVALRHPELGPLRTRIAYTHTLKPFALEDARNYVRFHLQRADANPKLFSDEAIKRLFHATLGTPRSINQLATQALIHGAVHGRETLDGDFLAAQITAHPLYQGSQPDR